MNDIIPRPGMPALYYPGSHDDIALGPDMMAGLAATVTGVRKDGTVNLCVLDFHGSATTRACVRIVDPDKFVPDNNSFAHWTHDTYALHALLRERYEREAEIQALEEENLGCPVDKTGIYAPTPGARAKNLVAVENMETDVLTAELGRRGFNVLPGAARIAAELKGEPLTAAQGRELNKPPSFERDLAALINRYSMENDSNTPDFILAQYMADCLEAFNRAHVARREWYAKPGGEERQPLGVMAP